MSNTDLKYDVFLSFRGKDTRNNFVSCLYTELVRCNIHTFKDDKDLKCGESIPMELIKAIEESRFAIVVVSKTYTKSRCCLSELVKIMDLKKKKKIEVIPIFYGVNPADVRHQNGEVAEHFAKHEGRVGVDLEVVRSWKQALTSLADISGLPSNGQNDSQLIGETANEISKRLRNAKPRRSGSKLEESHTHLKAIIEKLDLMSCPKTEREFGIWGTGSDCRSALAKYVYDNISQQFDCCFFLENVRRFDISDRHMRQLEKEFVHKIGVENWSLSRLKNKKVLLMLDDVNKLEQLNTLAKYYNSFGSGSIVIITTQDRLLLKSANIKHFYEVEPLRFKNVGKPLRQSAFNKRHESDSIRQNCNEKIVGNRFLRNDVVRLSTWLIWLITIGYEN